jgi:hypothetical protein
MLKKSASGVLMSLRGSTYGQEYASASSLAAALLDSLFDHPAGTHYASSIPAMGVHIRQVEIVFPQPARLFVYLHLRERRAKRHRV